MDVLVPALLVLGLFAAVLGGLVWVARRVRRRGGGMSMMGPFTEIWDPVRHRAIVEVQAQQEAPAPAPLPGDPPRLVRDREIAATTPR